MVLEDLQWADPTTRDWLGRVLRRLDEAPLLALIAVRSDARPDLLDTDTFHRLPLERLSREESAEIIDLVTEGTRSTPNCARRSWSPPMASRCSSKN